MPFPKLLVTVALTAMQMALTATRTIEGPRLKELDVTPADPGTPLPMGLGRVRTVAVNIYSEPLKEKKRKRKTKGGKYKEWVYFTTSAYCFAGHETQRVRRIWFDKHKVYDATGETVQSIGQGSDVIEDLDGENSEFTDLVSIYLGGEDQEPDPRMLAYIEAREGEGTCPAHRGKSYLMLKDFPIEKLGNRPPAIVEVEFDGAGLGDALSWLTIDSYLDNPDLNYPFLYSSFSPNGRYVFSLDAAHSGAWKTLDLNNNTINDVYDGTQPIYLGAALDDDGTVYGVNNVGLYSIDNFGAGAEVLRDDSWTGTVIRDGTLRLFVMPDTSRKLVWLEDNSPGFNAFVYDVSTDTVSEIANPASGWTPARLYQDMYEDVWAIGPGNDGTSLHFWRVIDNGSGSGAADHEVLTGLPAQVNASIEALHTPSGWFVSRNGGQTLYLLNEDDFSILASRNYGAAPLMLDPDLMPFLLGVPPGTEEFWFVGSGSLLSGGNYTSVEKIRASDLTTVASAQLTDWPVGDDPAAYSLAWSPYSNVLISTHDGAFGEEYTALRFFGEGQGELTLGTAIRYFSGLVGLTEGADYSIHPDCDAIPMTGYSWTQGQARQSLELILDIYGCEQRIHDGKPHFIKRGGAPTFALTTQDLVIEQGRPETRYKLTIANETDKPRRAVLTYANTDGSLQPATVKAERRLDAFDGVGELSIDGTTVSLEPDTAQQLLDRWFRRRHFTDLTAEQRTSNRHLAIESGDIGTIDFDGTTIVMHVDKVTDSADGSRHIVASNDDPAIAVLGEGVAPPQEGRPPDEIFAPGASTGELLDLPLLTDAHDQAAPFLYLGGGPVDPEASYVGTEFHQSDTGDDATYQAGWDGTGSSDPMTYGTVAVAPAADPLPWLWDSGTVLAVVLANGSLSNATEDQVLNNGTVNLFAYGAPGRWLLGQFRTATLTAPLTYNITNIIWGVRGTEHLIGTSQAGDRFILLDSAIARHTMGASEIGDTDWYIAAAPGATPNPADEFSLEFEANAHRPYSPVQGTLTLDSGSGDWSITATRRTRIGGATLNGQNVPLGEASEAWEADIYDGATFKRTITGSALPLTYTAAQQTTDFGAPQTSGFEVNLYQMNPTLDLRGTALALAA